MWQEDRYLIATDSFQYHLATKLPNMLILWRASTQNDTQIKIKDSPGYKVIKYTLVMAIKYKDISIQFKFSLAAVPMQ